MITLTAGMKALAFKSKDQNGKTISLGKKKLRRKIKNQSYLLLSILLLHFSHFFPLYAFDYCYASPN